MDGGYTRNVALVLYQGVEILDFAGPAEVFASAAGIGEDRGRPAYNAYTVATTRDPIVSQGFIDIVPDYDLASAPEPDVIVIPGGASTLTDDAVLMRWLERSRSGVEVTLTVCTGAMAPAVLGMLDGLTVTTHHGSLDRLRQLAPRARVEADRRFVDNGHIITTAGVSAGIDGSLHLVARLHGLEVAKQTARYMEYNWLPDAAQVADYPALNPSTDERGRELQQALIDAQAGNWQAAEQKLRSLLAVDPGEGYAWMLLTEVLRGQARWTDALETARETALRSGYAADGRFLEACALARLGRSDEALDALSAALDNGFATVWHLEQDKDLEALRGTDRFDALRARLRGGG